MPVIVSTESLTDESGANHHRNETTSQSATDSIDPSTHGASMISSVGSMSDDETFLDFELGNEDYINTELDYFYSEEKYKMQQVHSRNIEDADRELRERRLEAMQSLPDEEEINFDEVGTTPLSVVSLQDSSQESSPALPPPEQYEPQVGVVPPSLKALILQGQAEMRHRKVPEEHKQLFKPTCLEASEVGRFTRLNEKVLEAYGTKAKAEKTQLPSATWKHGQEQVALPKTNSETASNTFTLFNEAAALGKIKALKPKIVTNYDPLAQIAHHHQLDEYDIDDENKIKAMRTNFLTDVYIQGHLDHKKDDLWDGAELEEEVRYNSLDEVKLPTESCPTVKQTTTKMSNSELMQAIGQGVAEKAWERRYRLERPHAQQQITRTCTCKFCNHANPFQTRAYRKKWLVQQGLWKEPSEEEVYPAEEGEFVVDTEEPQNLLTCSVVDSIVEQPEIRSNAVDVSEDQNDNREHILPQESKNENEVDGSDAPLNDDIGHEVELEQATEMENLALGEEQSKEPTHVTESLTDTGSNNDIVKMALGSVDSACDKTAEDESSSADKLTNAKAPRRKKSFLRELGSMLGFVRPENDNSPSAKARRRRREKKQNREKKRQSNTSIRSNPVLGGKTAPNVPNTTLQVESKHMKSDPISKPVVEESPALLQHQQAKEEPVDSNHQSDLPVHVEIQNETHTAFDHENSANNAGVPEKALNIEDVGAKKSDGEEETDEDYASRTENSIDKGEEQESEPPVVASTGSSYLDELLQRKSNHFVEEPVNEEPVNEGPVSSSSGGYLDELLQRKSSHAAEELVNEEPVAATGGGGYLDEILKRKNRVDEEPPSEVLPSASCGGGGGVYLDEILKQEENNSAKEKPVLVDSGGGSGGGGYLDDIIKLRANRKCGAN
ncbi:MAG: hypothetical protein SGILL_000635 [Bacillariaceae sp.]